MGGTSGRSQRAAGDSVVSLTTAMNLTEGGVRPERRRPQIQLKVSTMPTFIDNIENIALRHNIAQYQAIALAELFDKTDIRGKKILEVGGSNLPRELVFGECGASEWVSVDILGSGYYQVKNQGAHYEREGIHSIQEIAGLVGTRDYLIFDGCIEMAQGLPSGYFDVVLSITSFEHILRFNSAMAQIMRAKKADGVLFSYHGPLWSSYCGHHIWVDDELNFNKRGTVPDFGHLILAPPEMFKEIERTFGTERAEEAVQQIYHSPRINRLFFEDYEMYFQMAGMSDLSVQAYGSEDLDRTILSMLRRMYPGRSNFSAYGIQVFGR